MVWKIKGVINGREMFWGFIFVDEDFQFFGYLKTKIGRQFEKRREKFERKMGVLDKFKSVPEKFFKNQQKRDQSKRDAPRENS